MITINLDFTTGKEISYYEGLEKGDNFSTSCLDFFSFSYDVEVKVIKKNGDYILKSELLGDKNPYTCKQVRKGHNIHKMLVANSFDFKKFGEKTEDNIKKLDMWWCHATEENRNKLIKDGFEVIELWEEDEFIIFENNEIGVTYLLPDDFKTEIRIEDEKWKVIKR